MKKTQIIHENNKKSFLHHYYIKEILIKKLGIDYVFSLGTKKDINNNLISSFKINFPLTGFKQLVSFQYDSQAYFYSSSIKKLLKKEVGAKLAKNLVQKWENRKINAEKYIKIAQYLIIRFNR